MSSKGQALITVSKSQPGLHVSGKIFGGFIGQVERSELPIASFTLDIASASKTLPP